MDIDETIRRAEAVLPGQVAPEGAEDPRWQAIIAIGEFIENEPDAVWDFVKRWGCHENEDLRMAIATCLIEHLLEFHFDLLFPRVERMARSNRRFADTLSSCWKFGQAEKNPNVERLDLLLKETAR